MANRGQGSPAMRPMRPGGPGGPPGRMLMAREKPKNAGKTIKRLISYIGASKYILYSLILIMIFVTLISIAGPALQGKAIDTITLKQNKLSVDFVKLFKLLGLMATIYVISSLFTYLQGIMSAKLSLTTVRNMRSDLFSKIQYLPISFVDTHPHGDIMSRMTNDVENVSNTISQSIGSLFSSVITVVGTLAIMLYYSPLLTVVSILTVPLSVFVTTNVAKYTRKFFIRQQALLGQLNGHIEDRVTGYKTVMAYGKEKRSIDEFNKISNELKSCGIKAQIFGGVMGPLMNIIGNFGFLLIAGFGGYLAFKGSITVGIIQTFLIYSQQFSRPINEIANQYTQIQTAIAGAERVFAVMDTPSEEDCGKMDFENGEAKGDISFENIFFSYKAGEPVLKDFNLEVKSGEKIAIVGTTGAGKTTIVNLLTRFYEVDSGSIKIDRIDIRDIPKSELRKNIAIVLQDTVLFSDSIGENIKYGKLDATKEQIQLAASNANADIFIERLPKGYDTELSEAGGNLSQGQQQLISIARAVLKDPKILILDEATSSVDTRTEMHIQEAMISLMKNRTSLIIAHRLSTIRDADRIIVVEDGKVKEVGNHDELLKMKGSYFNLYQNQFAGREI